MNRVRQFVLWSVIPTLSLILLTFGLALGGVSAHQAQAAGDTSYQYKDPVDYDGDCRQEAFDIRVGAVKDQTSLLPNPNYGFVDDQHNGSALMRRDKIQARVEDGKLKVLFWVRSYTTYHYIRIPQVLGTPDTLLYFAQTPPTGPQTDYADRIASNASIDTLSSFVNHWQKQPHNDGGYNNGWVFGENQMRDLFPANTNTYIKQYNWGLLTKWAGLPGQGTDNTIDINDITGTVFNASIYKNASDGSQFTQYGGVRGQYLLLSQIDGVPPTSQVNDIERQEYVNNKLFPLQNRNGDDDHIIGVYNPRGDYHTHYQVGYYFEAPIGQWNQKDPLGIEFAENGIGMGIIKLTPKKVGVTVHGYYDSPYLKSTLFANGAVEGSGDNEKYLPKGLKIRGYFYKDGANGAEDIIQNVTFYDKEAGKCKKSQDGYIDFDRIYDKSAGKYRSVENMRELWETMGQDEGRGFRLPDYDTVQKLNDVKFRLKIYKDVNFDRQNQPIFDDKSLASFKYNGSSEWIDDNTIPPQDYMREGYLRGEQNGKPTAVKVKYYLMAGKWGIMSGPEASEPKEFSVRVRPYVLKEKDPKYPLNPVATSPYRDLIKWIVFNKDEINTQLNATNSTPIERDIIPGFLKVKCTVNSVSSKNRDKLSEDGATPYFDLWPAGNYFEDGAPWLIGDGVDSGIHQRNNRNVTTVGLTCWGEQKDPQQGPNAKPVVVPLRGLAVMDAESTDDKETLKFQTDINTAGSAVAAAIYPISGFSSCSNTIGSWAGESGAGWTASSPAPFMQNGSINASLVAKGSFSYDGTWAKIDNAGGRCGEKSISGVGQSEYGLIFGPALMAVAPKDPTGNEGGLNWNSWITLTDTQRDDQAKKSFNVEMEGNGKEAIALGVIIPGDTSNADFNNGMPPAYQYSSLTFHAGSSQTGIDWSSPENYQRNYFYYGPRVGKKAKIYDPNDKTPLKVRDGSNNDAFGDNTRTINVQLGNDTEPRTQQKIIPNASVFDNGLAGKNYVGKDNKVLKCTATGCELTDITVEPMKKLKVTVPCGKYRAIQNYATPQTTVIAGWVDFNGNGVFDPQERATKLGTCGADQNDPVAESTRSGNDPVIRRDLPWTSTENVTLEFDYPEKFSQRHQDSPGFNSKPLIWMRLRAIGEPTVNDLTSPAKYLKRGSSNIVPGSAVRTQNPDVDIMPKADRSGETENSIDMKESASSSYEFITGGETEDFLLSITPPPASQPDAVCMNGSMNSVVFDPLANDMLSKGDARVDTYSGEHEWLLPGDKRKADKTSVRFLTKQDNPKVKASPDGRTATVEGEGTYTINPQSGVITFMPTAEFKNKIPSSGANSVKATPVIYAFQTGGEDNPEDVTTATSNRINLYGSAVCNASKSTVVRLNGASGQYSWSMNKKIQDDSNNFVKSFERQMAQNDSGKPVKHLYYKINLQAKVTKEPLYTSMNVDVKVDNTSVDDVVVKSVTLSATANGSTYQLDCKLPYGEVAENQAIKKQSSYVFEYSCVVKQNGSPVTSIPKDIQVFSSVSVQKGQENPYTAYDGDEGKAGVLQPGNNPGKDSDNPDKGVFVNLEDSIKDSVKDGSSEAYPLSDYRITGIYKAGTNTEYNEANSKVGNQSIGGILLDAQKVAANQGGVDIYLQLGPNTDGVTTAAPNEGMKSPNNPQVGKQKDIVNTVKLCDKTYGDQTCVPVPNRLKGSTENLADYPNGTKDSDTVLDDAATLKIISQANAGLMVRKAVYGSGSQLLAGAEFSVECQDSTGAFSSKKVLTPAKTEATSPVDYSPAKVTGSGQHIYSHYITDGDDNTIPMDTVCQLIETRAPTGRTLLPEPIYFKYVNGANNSAELKLLQKGTDGSYSNASETPSYLHLYQKGSEVNDGGNPGVEITQVKNKMAMIEVRDPERGRLPASGGQGIIVAMMLGVSLCGAAIVLRRRYQQL